MPYFAGRNSPPNSPRITLAVLPTPNAIKADTLGLPNRTERNHALGEIVGKRKVCEAHAFACRCGSICVVGHNAIPKTRNRRKPPKNAPVVNGVSGTS